MSSSYQVPTTYQLIHDYGQKVNLRCSCCGKPSLWEIVDKRGGYFLCSYCDVDQTLRRWS